MAKPSLDISFGTAEERRGRSKAKLAAALVAAALALPVAWEGCALLVSQWCEVFDKPFAVKTPILDYVARTYEDSREDLHDFLVPVVGSMTWRADLIFPVLLGLMVVGARILWRAPT